MQSRLALTLSLTSVVLATPTPVQPERAHSLTTPAPAPELVERGLLSSILNPAQLSSALSSYSALQDAKSISAAISVGEAILTAIVPGPGPTSIPQLESELSTLSKANPGDIFKYGAQLLLNGFTPGDYVQIAEAYTVLNSANNNNPAPKQKIYPQKAAGDAPYDISEAQLRQVIYIPPEFTYGKLPPVLFLPGSGVLAGENFGPNFGKLFKQNKIADPVYVNLPGQNLDDIQGAAEYVAYAINYIASVSGRNVSTISWSAGSLDAQWALKYWPSTRKVLDNKISLSGDYHGTIFAQLLCPGFVTPGSDPAVCQQNYNSTFIRTLRNNGGDKAYVPTTNVYSIFDEIVQPQEDPNASGALNFNGSQSALVSNTEIQSVCTALLPGGVPFVNHEGVLYNALAYALAVDAIQNAGPGQLSRINATAACEMFAAPGLSLPDILATEADIVIAAFNFIAFQPKSAAEPPIKAYAQKDTPPS